MPRRLDPDQAVLVSRATAIRYEEAFQAFVSWIIRNNHNPASAEHIDCLIVSYKNDVVPTRSALNHCIAAVEFYLPQCKGRLTWAK